MFLYEKEGEKNWVSGQTCLKGKKLFQGFKIKTRRAHDVYFRGFVPLHLSFVLYKLSKTVNNCFINTCFRWWIWNLRTLTVWILSNLFLPADTAAQRLCKNKCKVNIPTECFWQRRKFVRSLINYCLVQPKSHRCHHCTIEILPLTFASWCPLALGFMNTRL